MRCVDMLDCDSCYRLTSNLLFPDELVEKYENYSDKDVAIYLGISVSYVRVRRMQYHKN